MPLIREILRGQAALDALAAELRQVAEGTVRVGTFTSVAVHWLPGMMQAFQEKYPRVDFKLFNGDYHDVDRWLTDGSVDLAFTALPLRQRCPGHRPGGGPAAGHPPSGPPSGLPAGVPHGGAGALAVYHPAGILRPRLPAGAGEGRGAPGRALHHQGRLRHHRHGQQGMGVSIMPELLLEGRRDGIEVRPLDPPTSRTIALALPAGDRTGPAARKFADFAVAWVKARHAAG